MRNIFYIVLLSFVTACTSIKTAGDKPNKEYEHDLQSAYIILTDFIHKGRHSWLWQQHPGMTESADIFMKKIGVQAKLIWPQKFAQHGIQAEIALLSEQKQNHFSMIFINRPKSNLDYDLDIELKNVTPKVLGGFIVNYEVTLRDRRIFTGNKLWEGAVEIQKGVFAPSEADLANQMADKLISKMKETGAIQD